MAPNYGLSTSPFPSLNARLTTQPTTDSEDIYRLLKAHADQTPNAISILAPGRAPLTYGRLLKQVEYVAKTLNSIGVGRNDRVAIVLPNGPEMAVTCIAVAACATSAPLNPAYRTSELEFYLADLSAKALIVRSGFDSPAIAVAQERGIPVVELSPVLEAEAGIFTLAANQRSSAAHEGFAEPEDVALMLHISGTTLRAKIVPLTQANICASAQNIQAVLEITPNDRYLNVMPLFYSQGIMLTISSMLMGASVVCTPGFNPDHFFEWIEDSHPTWYSAAPTMHQAILAGSRDNREIIDRCPLRFIRSSASPLPPHVLAELERVFRSPVIEAYGMPECNPIACNPLPPGKRKAGSVGMAAGTEIAIVDAAGRLLPFGETGEIVVSGPHVMGGYSNESTDNKTTFTNGRFRTGDQGYMDADGYLFITGHLNETINRGGEKISPEEVDAVLLEHWAVSEAVTFGVPHATLGEDVAAAVVLREKISVTKEEIQRFAARRLAQFKVPRQLLIIEQIPKSATGKVQRIGLADKLGLTSPDQAARGKKAWIQHSQETIHPFSRETVHSSGPRIGLDERVQQRVKETSQIHSANSFVEFRREEIEQSIQSRFEQTVAKHPERVAVSIREVTLSYDALNKTANRVARAILAVCKKKKRPIALFLDHDEPMIAAILGVLKAGQIYVPLDPSFPHSRTEYIVEDSQAGLIVTSSKNLSLARELAKDSLELLNIDEINSSLSTENLDLPISPDSLAYILYTSGSTGKPKGVVQNHRNVLHDIMQYTNSLFISPEDRMTLLYSYSVNGAVRGIFGALLNGAALYPLDVKKEGLATLSDLLIQKEITFYHSVPTVFRNFVATLTGKEKFPILRVIRFGGERVLAQDVDLYKRFFPDNCVLYTGMGATETGHVCEYFIDKQTPITGSVVPTGFPVENKDVLLLGDTGEEVGFNHVGEIAVRSGYLSPGYWRNPELTQAVFLPDPVDGSKQIYRTGDLGRMRPDGCLEHLGRKDFQAKLRGYRIELAETEMALLDFPGIKEGVVMAREDRPGEQQLVGYLVAANQTAPSIRELRSFLKNRLPDYMVPSAFVLLDTLPLTPNGKVDRRALPPPDQSRPELDTLFVAAQDPVELQLAKIWEKILGVHPIGVTDNFFDLGGHSLLAAQLVGQIEKAFGSNLRPAILFQSPTIEQLAGILRQEKLPNKWSSLVPIQPKGSKPPFFLVHGDSSNALLPRYLGPDQPLYGLVHQSQNGEPVLYTHVETIAAHYLDELQAVQADGPYFLGGFSFGGVVAFEMAQQLRRQGEEVDLLVMIDSLFSGIPDSDFPSGLTGHLRGLAVLGTREKLAYVAATAMEKIRDQTARTNEILQKLVSQLCLAMGCRIPLRARSRYILEIYSQARQSYVPHPYPGQSLYIKSKKRSGDHRLKWSRLLAGGLEIHEVPGDHLDLIKEPYLGLWAGKLRDALHRSQTTWSQRIESENERNSEVLDIETNFGEDSAALQPHFASWSSVQHPSP